MHDDCSRFDRYQTECVIPWVNDVLLLLTVALQSAQQLKVGLPAMSKVIQVYTDMAAPFTFYLLKQISKCFHIYLLKVDVCRYCN